MAPTALPPLRHAFALAAALALAGLASATTPQGFLESTADSAVDSRLGPGTVLAISKDGAPRTLTGQVGPRQFGLHNACTANWLWTDGVGGLYLGTAGHCVLEAGEAGTADAANARVYACLGACPLGSLSAVAQSYAAPGWAELDVAYARFVGDEDFALLRVPEGLEASADPALKGWGGPAGIASDPRPGDRLVFHGNGAAFGETFATKSRAGVYLRGGADFWQGNFPDAGGDSGGPVGWQEDASAPVKALGIANQVSCDPLDIHGVPDLGERTLCAPAGVVPGGITIAKAVAMAAAEGFAIGLALAPAA